MNERDSSDPQNRVAVKGAPRYPLAVAKTLRARLLALDWDDLASALDARGWAKTGPVLSPRECAALRATWPKDARFRKRIDMESHSYGEGAYGYFARPLPRLVAELRQHAYPHLARVANRWASALGEAPRFPATLAEFLARCHEAGQNRPTPLLLRYGQGGYNRLHRDLYGDVVFPLQMTGFLSSPGREYEGGEFLLVEQKPRAQSRGEVIVGELGELLIFAVRERPAAGKRGYYRAGLRHGIATVRRGERYALGIIFHDAA
jgi:hypothetical protein